MKKTILKIALLCVGITHLSAAPMVNIVADENGDPPPICVISFTDPALGNRVSGALPGCNQQLGNLGFVGRFPTYLTVNNSTVLNPYQQECDVLFKPACVSRGYTFNYQFDFAGGFSTIPRPPLVPITSTVFSAGPLSVLVSFSFAVRDAAGICVWCDSVPVGSGIAYTFSRNQYEYRTVLDAAAIPEPSSLGLVGLGGLALWWRRRA